MKNLFFFLTALLLMSCSSDNDVNVNDDLVSTWLKITVDNNLEIRSFYNFQSDGTYFFTVTGVDVSTGEVLGYRAIEQGDFGTTGDILDLNIVSYRISPNESFVPIIELVEVTTGNPSYTFTLMGDGQILSLIPICGPLENCVGEQLFERVIQEF